MIDGKRKTIDSTFERRPKPSLTWGGEQCIWERIVENILVVWTRAQKMASNYQRIIVDPLVVF